MKSSRYNFFFEHSDNRYVYNLLSGALLQIDEKTQRSLLANKLQGFSFEIHNAFIENGVIVEPNLDETSAYLYFFDHSRYSNAIKTLNITIIPTYKCNLKCTYCFQSNIDMAKDMIDADIEKIAMFIEKQILESRPKSLRIAFYGGEPLLKKQLCIDIANKLSKIAKTYNIEYETQITTNGIMLDKEIIEKLIKPHKMYIQLTIDGLEKTHDSKRKFKSGKGTYNIINSSIDRLINMGFGKYISLRINIDKNNISEADEILSFYKQKIKDVYFSYIAQPVNYKTGKYSSDYNGMCISREECLHSYQHKVSNILKKNGMNPRTESFGKKGPCYINCENRFFIEPNLSIYKCDILLSIKEHCVGRISTNGELIIYPAFYNQMHRSPSKFEKCKSCFFLPGCGSGCAGYAFLENGDINIPNCELNEFLLKSSLINYLELNE